MKRTDIRCDSAPAPLGGYSQAIRAGDWLYVSGTTGIDPVAGAFTSDTVAGQTDQAISNIENVLRSAGAGLRDIVKATVHLADVRTFAEFDAVYVRRLPRPYPARTTIGSDLSHVPRMLIEIDVVAHVQQPTSAHQPSDS